MSLIARIGRAVADAWEVGRVPRARRLTYSRVNGRSYETEYAYAVALAHGVSELPARVSDNDPRHPKSVEEIDFSHRGEWTQEWPSVWRAPVGYVKPKPQKPRRRCPCCGHILEAKRARLIGALH